MIAQNDYTRVFVSEILLFLGQQTYGCCNLDQFFFFSSLSAKSPRTYVHHQEMYVTLVPMVENSTRDLKRNGTRAPVPLETLEFYSYLFLHVNKAVREVKNKAIKITKDRLA